MNISVGTFIAIACQGEVGESAPVNTVAPSLSAADYNVGTTVTVSLGTWTGATALAGSLRHVSDDTEIDTFTADGTYLLLDADFGEELYLYVVPDGNAAAAVASAAVGPVGYAESAALIEALTVATPTGKDVTLQYLTSTTRRVWTPSGEGLKWGSWDLSEQATGYWSMRGTALNSVVKAVASNDGGLVYSGTWQTVTGIASALATQWVRTDTLNSYVEYTFTGQDHIYIVHTTNNNAGYGAVTINGSTALVNELAGAQLNCYSAAEAQNVRTLVATGLNPASNYTIRITHTDTKPAESSREYVYFEGFGFEALTINDADVYGIANAIKGLRNLGYSGSAYEFVVSYKPTTGALGYEWTGSDHGHQDIDTVTWEDESGADMTVSVGTPRMSGERIVLEMVGTTLHVDTGATPHADVLIRATFDADGCTSFTQYDWTSNATCDLAYPHMLPVRPEINVGIVGGTHYPLTAGDGAYNGQVKENAIALWASGTNHVIWMYAPDLVGVDTWLASDYLASIEDRAGNTLNKGYIQRVGSVSGQPTATITSGDTWQATTHYRMVQFTNPDANL